jgi:hypothetical protein
VIAEVRWLAQGQVAAMRSRRRRAAAGQAAGGGEQAQPQAFGFPPAGGALQSEYLIFPP